MDKKIYVKEFVNKFNTLSVNEQDDYVKSIINNNYVNYEDKIKYCDKVIKVTSYKKETINGVERKYLHTDSTARYMLYSLTLVKLYTNIDIDFKDALNQFNLLNGGNHAIDVIIDNIPAREMKEMKLVLDLLNEDVMKNEYDIISFIKKQSNKLSIINNNWTSKLINEIAKHGVGDIK